MLESIGGWLGSIWHVVEPFVWQTAAGVLAAVLAWVKGKQIVANRKAKK